MRCCRRIDPDGDWLFGWLGWFTDEALRGCAEGAIEGFLAGGVDRIGLAVMDLIGRHEAEAGMMVILVVPVEEAPAESLCILDAAEAAGKLRLVFQGLEVAFGERIVVRGIRPAV